MFLKDCWGKLHPDSPALHTQRKAAETLAFRDGCQSRRLGSQMEPLRGLSQLSSLAESTLQRGLQALGPDRGFQWTRRWRWGLGDTPVMGAEDPTNFYRHAGVWHHEWCPFGGPSTLPKESQQVIALLLWKVPSRTMGWQVPGPVAMASMNGDEATTSAMVWPP